MKMPKRILVLSQSEYRLTLYGLLCFRNKLIEQGADTRMLSTSFWRSSSEPGGATMDKSLAQRLKAYIETHPFDSGDSDYETVLDQLYQAYAESHESDPPEIGEGFKEFGGLPLHTASG